MMEFVINDKMDNGDDDCLTVKASNARGITVRALTLTPVLVFVLCIKLYF